MDIPQHSQLYEYAQGAYFADSFSRDIPYRQQTALEIYLEIAKQTPAWVAFLMNMRNRIAAKLGLKHLGRFQDVTPGHYQAGDRIGIFTLVSNSEREIVLEDQDQHLDVRVSFLIDVKGETATVHATTVVRVHNRLGRLYMWVVTPIHKRIVPSSLKALS